MRYHGQLGPKLAPLAQEPVARDGIDPAQARLEPELLDRLVQGQEQPLEVRGIDIDSC